MSSDVRVGRACPHCRAGQQRLTPDGWMCVGCARLVEPEPVERGRKFDTEKTRYDLIPPLALDAFARVLTFGARKYAPDNWRHVEGRRWRYFSAAMRHLWAWWRGEKTDAETGESHLACAMCCVAFLLDEEEATRLDTSDRQQ